jgi:hypothetical protein
VLTTPLEAIRQLVMQSKTELEPEQNLGRLRVVKSLLMQVKRSGISWKVAAQAGADKQR